jgi:hypothetical protein
MSGEGTQLRVEVRIKPIRLLHAGFQVVEHQSPGHAAEVGESVFQTADEVLGGLAINGLAVTLARVAQNDAKDLSASASAIGLQDGNAATEIDLSFFAGDTFHAAKRKRPTAAQPPHKTLHAVVARLKAVFAYQVLVDALGRQPLL